LQKLKWLSRHADGKHFPVISAGRLPKLNIPKQAFLKKVHGIELEDLVFRESRPVNLEERAKYFVKQLIAGYPVAPIMVERIGEKKWLVWDGHARAEAHRLLGIKKIPAVMAKKRKELGMFR
jgi:hypothetical protein